MTNTIEKKIKDTAAHIIESIKNDDVKMTPAWHFTLKTVLLIGGLVLIFGFSIYFVSLILFIVTGNALQTLPALGMSGMILFTSSLPWLLIVLSAALISMLEFFSTQLRIVYKRPLVYSSATVLILVIAGGALASQTVLHERLYTMSQEGRLPLGRAYKEYVVRTPVDMHIGVVHEITEESFILLTQLGAQKNVHMTATTRKPRHLLLEEGMTVVVIGKDDNGIVARGIRLLKDERRLLPREKREPFLQ